MADNKDIPAYPLMFDPSQWSNKYSPFPGQPIPWGQYSGGATGPTDAMGRPIQSYQTAQAAAAAAPQQAPPVTLNSTPALLSPQLAAQGFGNRSVGGGMVQDYGPNQAFGGQSIPFGPAHPAAQQPAAAPQPAAPAGPDMNAAYLAALQNPGHVTTPGATVPQSPTPSNQSGVLQQFLQNWNQGGQQTTGAGNYNNAGFFNALKGQV
jgi:hypothetical protein